MVQREYKDESLKPVTIKQLLDARDLGNGENFEIDGHPFTQITFVGQVRSISVQETRIRFLVDDGTGEVDVSKFTAEAMNEDMEELPKQDSYVRVFGRLRNVGNKKNVSAQFVRPITDFNEISGHLLEATYVHLLCKIGPVDQLAANNQNAYGGAQQHAGGNTNGGGNSRLASLRPTVRQVMEFMNNTEQGSEGIHMTEIARNTNIPLDQVKRAGEELLSLGMLYTTMDDETWAPLVEV